MKQLFLTAGLASLLLAAGCRKPDSVECSPTAADTSQASLADFSRRNGVATQTFTITLGAGVQTVTTRGGAVLSLPGSNFVRPDGSAATGPAQVRVRELYTVPDMLLSNQSTNQPTYYGLLVSGGEFNIQVYSNAQRLRLATGSLTLLSPKPADQDTTRQRLWNQPAAIAASDTASWWRANAPAVQTLPTGYQAFLPLDSVGWWNIDQYWHLYQTSALGTVQVNTPAGTSRTMRVCLRPVGFNSLARLYTRNAAGTEWTFPGGMPVGSTQVAVVLQLLNGQLYYGTQRFTVQTNNLLTPVLAPVSEAEAVRLIRQL